MIWHHPSETTTQTGCLEFQVEVNHQEPRVGNAHLSQQTWSNPEKGPFYRMSSSSNNQFFQAICGCFFGGVSLLFQPIQPEHSEFRTPFKPWKIPTINLKHPCAWTSKQPPSRGFQVLGSIPLKQPLKTDALFRVPNKSGMIPNWFQNWIIIF